MSAVASPVERLVTLSGVSWETYERLLAEHQDQGGTRFTYNEGTLEIMVASSRHEQPSRVLAELVGVVAEEFGINLCPLGSMTFKRSDLVKGFEPDSGYYVGRDSTFWGMEVDPAVDPPPDLILEVDVTSWSLDRFPIFAAFGVPEIWRYDGSRVAIFRLLEGRYVEVERSQALPAVTGPVATRFLEESRRRNRTQWLRQVREWAQARVRASEPPAS